MPTSNNTIPSHFRPTPLDDKVSKAEMLWSVFSVEHQLSFKISDHATKMFAKMLLDSQIAAKCSCGRTETKAMVRNVIADNLKNSTVSAIKSDPFSLLTDNSTDTTNQQQCCLLGRYFDNTTGFAKDSFYKVLHLSRATGESICIF